MSAAARAAATPEVAWIGRHRFPEAREPGLGDWLGELLAELAPGFDSFGVRCVGDRTMRRMNLEFRGLDATTDVLSFPGGVTPDGRHLGDVVLSVPQAIRQAAAVGRPAARELRALLLHGVLHCLGFDHETDHGEMHKTERGLRRRWLS